MAERLRKESCLYLFSDLQFAGASAFSFQFLRDQATLSLNLLAHLVGSEKVKGVSIQIAKTRQMSRPTIVAAEDEGSGRLGSPRDDMSHRYPSNKANLRGTSD